MVYDLYPDHGGPTDDDLAVIEAEWPLIEAELALLDAEIWVMNAGPAALDLDWRRLRRAHRRVLRTAALLAAPARVDVGRAA
jgi:hypothetical protein